MKLVHVTVFSVVIGAKEKNVTRVNIRPTGVESKNNIGALKIEFVKPEKKALDAFNPRRAAKRDLRYTKNALTNDTEL